ncbi:MAG: hypothetical protein GY882_01910 [Actinomycetia bacterium]|nr:hypothetical protein [Actinomycetes bacterium]MCP4845036.1 hypothetical protein [Actinomycetes bacterium]
MDTHRHPDPSFAADGGDQAEGLIAGQLREQAEVRTLNELGIPTAWFYGMFDDLERFLPSLPVADLLDAEAAMLKELAGVYDQVAAQGDQIADDVLWNFASAIASGPRSAIDRFRNAWDAETSCVRKIMLLVFAEAAVGHCRLILGDDASADVTAYTVEQAFNDEANWVVTDGYTVDEAMQDLAISLTDWENLSEVDSDLNMPAMLLAAADECGYGQQVDEAMRLAAAHVYSTLAVPAFDLD